MFKIITIAITLNIAHPIVVDAPLVTFTLVKEYNIHGRITRTLSFIPINTLYKPNLKGLKIVWYAHNDVKRRIIAQVCKNKWSLMKTKIIA